MPRKPAAALLIILSLLAAGLIGLALFLPAILTDRINARLRRIPGYEGRIEKSSVSLWKGTVVVEKFHLKKLEASAPGAFLEADRIAAAVSRRQLLRGRLALRLWITRPKALFLMRQRKPGEPPKFGLWQKFFEKTPGFRVDRLEISGGDIRIRNDEDIPATDIYFDRVNASALGMANRKTLAGPGPVQIEGQGRMMNHAPLSLSIEVRPFQPHAAFRLKGKLRDFQLTTLNNALRHYTGVDLDSGTLDVEGDLEGEDGEFRGPVARGVRDLKARSRHEHLTFIQAAKEFVFEAWAKRGADRRGNVKADFDLAGPLGYMDEDVFLACVWASKCAFLQSLRPKPPREIRLGTPEQAQEEWLALQAREREKKSKAAAPPVH